MMKIPANKKLLLIFIFMATVILPSASILAQVDEDVESQIGQEKTELDKLKAKISAQEKAIKKAGAKESSALLMLQKIGNRLKLKERELKIYQWNKKINRKKILQLEKQIALAETQLSGQRKILGKRLRAIYKEGSMFPVKVLFSSDNFNDLIQRVKYMELVTEYDSNIFGKYNSRFEQLEGEKRALLDARTKLDRLEKDTEKNKEDINTRKNEKSVFLKKIKNEKSLKVKIKNELLMASKNLNGLISRLEEKLVLGQGLDIIDKKGKLILPVSGKFLNKFGKKRDKQYDTFIVYNGIDIKVQKGTPVRSIFAGKVLYANELKGYGNLIIIGHGNDYHSLYGHLDEIITKVGRTIRSSQIIGRSGDTGSLVGETLYFELRHKGNPIEPTRWFQTAKR
jgi:septal ring factor EnvC (AmiA/AmiB activator)